MVRLKLAPAAASISLMVVMLAACASPSAPAPTAAPAATVLSSSATQAPTAAPAPATAVATPASPVSAETTVKLANDANLGSILTDAKGMTLYRFTKDQAGASSCDGQCAQNWPPLLVTAGTPTAPSGLPGALGLITRKDGARQVTYNGIPLYTWVKDAKPGDTTGQNVGNVWFVAKPGEIAVAEGQPILKVAHDPKLGNLLADANGWTLYLYTKDQPNASTCDGKCAQNWPPAMVVGGNPTLPTGVPGQLSAIDRKDGTKQPTYNGIPLYYWVKDAKPGDTTGQDVGKVWFVVPPKAAPAAGNGSAASTPSSSDSNKSGGYNY